jgi:DNA-binding transcriptional ArsR family regulator
MRRSDWAQPIDTATAYKRAAGRRAFNARRRAAVMVRRRRIIDLLRENDALSRDELARLLGVSIRTISGDLRALAVHEAEHRPITLSRRAISVPERTPARASEPAPATPPPPELRQLIESGDGLLAQLIARVSGENDGR